jgi:23S rRNA (uracil1939-C5)-methyltransferase
MKMPKKQTAAQRRAKQAAKRHSAASNKSGKHPARAKQAAGKLEFDSALYQRTTSVVPRMQPNKGRALAPPECVSAISPENRPFSAASKARAGSSGLSVGVKTNPQKPSEPQLVEIEKPIYGGAFLARLEGKAVFVPLALPCEQALARITESKRGYATAEVEEIIRAAPQRIAPACPHFGACGGCHYQHADYATQLKFKQVILRETLERGGVVVPAEIAVLAGEPQTQSWHYRNRIRLAFDAAGDTGYRGRRSHAVVPVRECPIAAPLLVEAALAFAQVARGFAPALRPTEIALFCDAAESALLATVFTASPPKIRFDLLAEAMRERIPALAGAELVVDGREGSLVSAGQQRILAQWGAASLTYHAAGFDYRVDHGAFFQVNRWRVDALVERVTAGHHGRLAWDLFAGVGLFARQLAARFERVVAVESSPSALEALAANLKGTAGLPVRGETLGFLRIQASHRAKGSAAADLIVVDPPRTGLGAESCALLAEIAAPALVYVSCDPATLARDLRALIASGYAIESITLADLFPQTFHLETVVQLRRA